MQINVLANNNYIAFKQALKIVFGGKGSFRQVFKERKLYGLVFKDDIEDALNGYYNDDKYFMRMIEEDRETIIYMKNVLMIAAEKQKKEAEI